LLDWLLAIDVARQKAKQKTGPTDEEFLQT